MEEVKTIDLSKVETAKIEIGDCEGTGTSEYYKNTEKIPLVCACEPCESFEEKRASDKSYARKAYICTLDGVVIAEGYCYLGSGKLREAYDFNVNTPGCLHQLSFGKRKIGTFPCSRDKISAFLAERLAQNPELCEKVPAGVYHALPTLSQEVLMEYQQRVWKENSQMGAGVDRTSWVAEVEETTKKMRDTFDILEDIKSENLFKGISFDRTKK